MLSPIHNKQYIRENYPYTRVAAEGVLRDKYTLGKGAHGKAKLAHSTRDDVDVVVKVQPLSRQSHQEAALHSLVSALKIPNVVGYLDSAVSEKKRYMVIEKGELLDASRLSLSDVFEVMKGLTEGLSELHRYHVYHRDITSTTPWGEPYKHMNLVLMNGDPKQVRIIDFGKSVISPTRLFGKLCDFADARGACRALQSILKVVNPAEAQAFKTWYLSQPTLNIEALKAYPAVAHHFGVLPKPVKTGWRGFVAGAWGRVQYAFLATLEMLTARVPTANRSLDDI